MTLHDAAIESAPISQRSARKNVLERLKLETAAEHAAAERTTGVMSPDLTLAQYRAYLERTYGFQKVADEQLVRAGVWEVLNLPAAERLKAPQLERDLARLGVSDVSQLPLVAAPPVWPGVAEAIGGAYVLEGATLGGRVISRHIQHRFGPDAPRDFLECYGPRTGESWQAFRAAVLRFAGSRELEDRVIAGAKSTFEAFTSWLAR